MSIISASASIIWSIIYLADIHELEVTSEPEVTYEDVDAVDEAVKDETPEQDSESILAAVNGVFGEKNMMSKRTSSQHQALITVIKSKLISSGEKSFLTPSWQKVT